MPRLPSYLARLVVVAVFAAGLPGLAPVAAAGPSSFIGQSAESVVDDLQSQGYNVNINWVNGFDVKPLSDCWVTGVNNPGNVAPSEGTFTTVYVDVRCPNGDDGGDFGFGVGIG